MSAEAVGGGGQAGARDARSRQIARQRRGGQFGMGLRWYSCSTQAWVARLRVSRLAFEHRHQASFHAAPKASCLAF